MSDVRRPTSESSAFDLPVFELDRRGATKNCDRNAEFAALGIDFFDDPGLVLEWAIGDFHRFTDFEAYFRFYFFFTLFHLREHAFDFRLAHRDRFVLRAGKTDYARRIADEIPGATDELIIFVKQVHVDD